MSERGGGPRVEGSALRERWARGDRAWVYGGDRAIALRVSEREGVLRSLHASGALREWDLSTGELRGVRSSTRSGTTARAGAIDASGERVLLVSGKGVMWVGEARSGTVLATLENFQQLSPGEYDGFADDVTRFDGFSHDGSQVLGAFQSLKHRQWLAGVWDASSGERLEGWWPSAAPVWDAAREGYYSLEGKQLSYSGAASLEHATSWVLDVPALDRPGIAVSGDGATLVVYGREKRRGRDDSPRARLVVLGVDADQGEVRWRVEHEIDWRDPLVTAVPGGALLFVRGRESVCLDARTGQPCSYAPKLAAAFDESADARGYAEERAVHYDALHGRIHRFGGSSGEEIHARERTLGAIRNVALARSGGRAVTANLAHEVRVWSVARAETEWHLEPGEWVFSMQGVALSPDEREAYAVAFDKLLRWSVESGMSLGSVAPASGSKLHGELARGGLYDLRGPWVYPDGSKMLLLGSTRGYPSKRLLFALDAASGAAQWGSEMGGAASYGVRLARHEPVVLAAQSNDVLVAALDRETGEQRGELGRLQARSNVVALEAVLPETRGVAWGVANGRLHVLGDASLVGEVSDASDAKVAGPLVESDDQRWLCTGELAGDALLWALSSDERGRRGAQLAGRIELASDHDRVASADFDARGEPLLIGTERGLLLCYDLRAS